MAVDRRLFLQLHRVHRVLSTYVNTRTLEALGVSTAQLATMYFVAKHPACTATDIADTLDLNKSATSGMLQRLERAGLLERRPNPKDGRGSLLTLTAKGESVRAQSIGLTQKLSNEITHGFRREEMDTVARFFSSVLERFGREAREEGDTP